MQMFLKSRDWVRSVRCSEKNKEAKRPRTEPQGTQTFRDPMKAQEWAEETEKEKLQREEESGEGCHRR